ncbi:MAG: N-acetyltransferase [Planctomycetia bacterium]|nr:N-acetyltransferase [Planctomycetia bacterium]
MSSELIVTAVQSRKDRKDFLKLPWTIYEGDPNWIPPLLVSHLGLIGFKKDAYYIRNKIQTFIARRGGKTVGRIAAILNQGHLDLYHDNRGFFGFFECFEDQEAANALFNAARVWLASHNIYNIRGPMNPSVNHELGTLIDGFQHRPMFMMTYNKPYYGQLIENYGFQKTQDMYAYTGYIEMLPNIMKRYRNFAQQIKERFHIRTRPLDTKNLEKDIRLFLDIYNHSISNTWGYVPMSQEELDQEAAGLKLLIVRELVVAAEIDGKTVGAIICLPDFNPRIKAIHGRIFPFGWTKLLWNKHAIQDIRVISVNVLPEYQMMGIPLVMLSDFVPLAQKWGIKKAEFSWVLESNSYSRGSLEKAGTIQEKTYRIYDFNASDKK